MSTFKAFRKNALAVKMSKEVFLKSLKKAVLISAILVMGYVMHCFFIEGETRVCISELGPLEGFQAVVLAITCALFTVAAFSKKFSNRAIPALFAVLTYALFLREVDFDVMNLPFAVEFMLYGTGRHLTVAILAALILGYACFHFRRYFNASLRFLKSPTINLMIVGTLFLLCGWRLDCYEDNQLAQFFEETTELIGYMFIFIAASKFLESKLPDAENASEVDFI